ncbi:Regucalcin [Yarrowia sp. C11]|nr:Regucalcin [Yarrowia sp. C11]KAG5364739.1 Regucalcin [Yarrowia sp. E02]
MAEILIDSRYKLGECPTYDSRDNSLAWTDILGETVQRIDYDDPSVVTTLKTPCSVGCIGLTQTPGVYIAGTKLGVALLDFHQQTDQFQIIKSFDELALDADIRANDGAVGPDGRFWVSTMAEDVDQKVSPRGRLFVYDGKTLEEVSGYEVHIPNGMAWLDGTVSGPFVFTDSANHRLLKDQKPFIEIENIAGCSMHPEPDGLALSEDGDLWTAQFGASRVRRYSPEGVLKDEIKFPAACITCPTFAGKDYNELIATSFDDGKDEGGKVFRVKLEGVKGVPKYVFGTTE